MPTLSHLPPRPRDAHKGNFGRVQIIGGSDSMAGAPALAALAALRSGAGLVNIACPDDVRSIVAGLVPCATTLRVEDYKNFEATVRGIGPGLGHSLSDSQLMNLLGEQSVPMVLDADGLNRLASIKEWWQHTSTHTILTPHPGEMKRLCESAGLAFDLRARTEVALALAQRSRAIVVLKGAGTVITDGHRHEINNTGNPGMATGGSGDVLTGVITGLLGQGLSPYNAAILGVYLHGLAGDLAAKQLGEISLIATDLIDNLPAAFRQLPAA
ncbi:MAG: Bifunctional NAD(P)H-hydrate repair enzyme Nnr [Phycisphaerae bacterium]|nr:Bifunctional NAD(P)H-hydrate repair enzyme Nnr [Phycisphaerae bacterium]